MLSKICSIIRKYFKSKTKVTPKHKRNPPPLIFGFRALQVYLTYDVSKRRVCIEKLFSQLQARHGISRFNIVLGIFLDKLTNEELCKLISILPKIDVETKITRDELIALFNKKYRSN